MTSGGGTTITILNARLRLVHVAREQLQNLMSPIIDCWWFRGEKDPFFALCVNGVEVSLFADAGIVRRCFGDWMDDDSSSEEDGGSDSSSEEEEEEPEDDYEALPQEEDLEEHAGESGITLGPGPGVRRRERDRERAMRERERELQRARKQKRKEEVREGEEPHVKVGEAIWVALEVAIHGDGWEEAGQRVKELSSPLSDSGVSIFFLSTYSSDYILVQSSLLSSVTAILEASGFSFTPSDESDDESPLSPRRRDTSQSVGNPASERSSLAGSLIFSDRGSTGGSPSGSRSSASIATGFRPNPSSLSASSPSHSAPPSATTSPRTTTTPLPPVPAFTPGNSLSVLPDELVCVGLSRPHEEFWRSKIVQAIFYPSRVLPAPPPPPSPSPSPARPPHHLLPLGSLSERSTPTSSLRTLAPPSSTAFASPTTSSFPPSRSSSAPPSRPPSTHPIPFVALTQTPDGTSLTADIRLLRSIFCEAEEVEMVYAVGEGGLRGVWQGEEEDEAEVGGWERGRRGREEEGEWEEEEREEERRERREKATRAGEGGRRLLKCLQLDLVSYGLDKHGIVEHFAGLLIGGGINLLFQSAFGSANILVAKSDLAKAQAILEESGRMPV